MLESPYFPNVILPEAAKKVQGEIHAGQAKEGKLRKGWGRTK